MPGKSELQLITWPKIVEYGGKKALPGVILGYQRGPNEQYPNYVLVRVARDYKEACRLIGHKVVYKDKWGNEYIGKVVRAHGKNGVVVVRFRRNIPGQAIGDDCYVLLEDEEVEWWVSRLSA